MHIQLTDQEQNKEKLQQITVLIAYFYQINAYQISHNTYMYSLIYNVNYIISYKYTQQPSRKKFTIDSIRRKPMSFRDSILYSLVPTLGQQVLIRTKLTDCSQHC